MEPLDRAAESERPASRPADVECLARAHEVAQATAFEELHDREGLTRLGLPELEDADEPRVARRDGGDRPAHASDRTDDVGNGGERARKESDRDSLRGHLVFGGPHGSECAGSQLADDPVAVPKPLADVRALADIAAHTGSSAELMPAPLRRLNRESSVAAPRRGGCRSRSRSRRRFPCIEWTRGCPFLPEPS